MIRSKLFGALVALPLMVAGAGSAQANVIALVIDGSGSMDTNEFNLQKQGYVTALTNLLHADGLNSIGVWQFSTTVGASFFGITKISTATDKSNLINFISNMNQLGGQTAIGAGIQTATNAIQTFYGTANCTGVNTGKCGNKLIDVSTDGGENQGTNPAAKSAAAFALGIKVNCLGIGSGADCSFNDGYGQDWVSNDFNAFTAAITAKLTAELTPTPEPITLTLFGAGLAGVAGLRRRRNAKTA